MTKVGSFITYSFLGSYLINGDKSGLTDDLIELADLAVVQLEKKVGRKIDIFDCVSDGFTYPTYPIIGGLPKGNCSIYTYLY